MAPLDLCLLIVVELIRLACTGQIPSIECLKWFDLVENARPNLTYVVFCINLAIDQIAQLMDPDGPFQLGSCKEDEVAISRSTDRKG